SDLDEGLEYLVHLPAGLKQQVPAVFQLEDRVLVMKGAPLLLLPIESKAKTGGINPTLAELEQAPCSPLLGQGICDFGQVRSVGDGSKAVVLFRESDSGFLCLTSHVFVTVQHYLCAEGRMSAHLDRQVTPVRVEDMERIMIHVRPWLFGHKLAEFTSARHLCFPNQCRRLRHQNHEESWLGFVRSALLLRHLVLVSAGRAVGHWDLVFLCPSPQTPTEASGHAYQMVVVQVVVRAVQRTPPHAQSSTGLPHAEVRITDHALHAIVTAV